MSSPLRQRVNHEGVPNRWIASLSGADNDGGGGGYVGAAADGGESSVDLESGDGGESFFVSGYDDDAHEYLNEPSEHGFTEESRPAKISFDLESLQSGKTSVLNRYHEAFDSESKMSTSSMSETND